MNEVIFRIMLIGMFPPYEIDKNTEASNWRQKNTFTLIAVVGGAQRSN